MKRKRSYPCVIASTNTDFLDYVVPAIIQDAFIDGEFYVVSSIYEDIKYQVKISFIHSASKVVGKSIDEIRDWFYKDVLAELQIMYIDGVFYFRDQINLYPPYILASLKQGLKEVGDLECYFEVVFTRKKQEEIQREKGYFDELQAWLQDTLHPTEKFEIDCILMKV
jgi:hypothetical protein